MNHLRRELAAFAVMLGAIAVLAVCLEPHVREARAQRQAPTWIQPISTGGGGNQTAAAAAQNQTQWFFDPSNSSGCAADNNSSCGLSTCGTAGDGPCVHFSEIASRWAGFAAGTDAVNLVNLTPLTVAPTTITQMSSMSAAQLTSDPITLTPRFSSRDGGSGNWLTFVCTLPAPNTCTLGVVTAKNRTTTPGTELSSTFLNTTDGGSCGVGPLQLVHNTTHNSWAWIRASGGGFRITQPLLTSALNVGGAVSIPVSAEVDTWAAADAVNVYASLVQTKITKIRPYTEFQGPNEAGFVVVQNCDLTFSGLENNGDNTIDVGRNVLLQDGQSDYVVAVDDAYVNDNGATAGSSNWAYTGGFSGGFRGSSVQPSATGQGLGLWQILGGMTYQQGAQVPNAVFNGVHLDADTVLWGGSRLVFTGYNSAGYLDLESPGGFTMSDGVLDLKTFNEYGGNVLWSRLSPTVNAGEGTIVFPFGSSGGTSAFPGSPTLQGQAASAGYLYGQAASALQFNVAFTPANLNTFPDGGALCATTRGCFTNMGP